MTLKKYERQVFKQGNGEKRRWAAQGQ